MMEWFDDDILVVRSRLRKNKRNYTEQSMINHISRIEWYNKLSDLEALISVMVFMGYPTVIIADQIKISVKTVYRYLTIIERKIYGL